MILLKEKYVMTVKRPYPPLWGSFTISGATNESVYTPFFSKPYARKGTILLGYVFYNLIESEEMGRQLILEEWTNGEIIDKNIKILREREEKLLRSTDAVFPKFSLAYTEYMAALTLVYLAERPFYDQLRAAFLKYVSEKEANALLDALNVPLEDNYYKKEELDLLRSSDLSEHVKKYEWFLSRYGSNTPYTIEEARKKLALVDREKFLEGYQSGKDKVQKAIVSSKEILGEADAYLVDALQFIIFYRTHRTDVMNRVEYLYIPILTKMAEEFGITYEDILFCTKDEILQNTIPSKQIIEEREKGHVVATIAERVVCISGKEYSAIQKRFEDTTHHTDEIRGKVAYKGVVSGKVKVIRDIGDFAKVADGDIIVASMTTPEMIPVLKLAAAFVTDEGGITCHAAIVAREMRKPCVIGTKFATQILKDGMRIEVNADRGIVKII
ncbi:MAG: Phosphoenolpyruvate synthase/pyruvate phosphate dikinase [Parcubacteria group bacterium GW2011_GWA2_47_16]|nr:MAG: Phosphoenolpyruvate synthase/pyruvate phosphate dikinase [Parcubacteria group bacterium GW2011_GWA2_47_16]